MHIYFAKARRNPVWMLALLVSALGCSQAAGPPPVSEQEVTTVFVVRHAEKADQSQDPDLSELGRERAEQLAHVLQNAGVGRLYASQFKRTQQTVQPLAEALGLQPVIIDANDLDELVRRVQEENRGGSAAIASHSNLVPEIVRKLGAPTDVEITEQQYDDLFVVTLQAGSAHLIHLKYGRPTE